MNDKYVDIFYIATGVYNTYFENFFGTIDRFLPGWVKRVHVITNDEDYYTRFVGVKGNVFVETHYQMDMPYPIIPLMKTAFIKRYVTEDMRYVFYMDADTVFLEKSPEYWREFVYQLDNNQILVAHHPGDMHPEYKVDEKSVAFIPDGEFYFPIISSFYGGKRDEIVKMCYQMDKKIRHDLTTHVGGHQEHYIPPLFDQDYMTKTVYESNGLSFLVRYFVCITWLINGNDILSENVVQQKYDVERKFETKNME